MQPERLHGRQMVPQDIRLLREQMLEASSAPWLVVLKIPAPAPRGSAHRGWARSRVGGQDIPPAGQPTSGEGGSVSLARLSGIRASPSLHKGWDDGLFSPAAGAWQLPGDASPVSWHGRKCLSGWSVCVLGSNWPSPHPDAQADLGHLQESVASGRAPVVSLGSPR